MKPGDRVKAWIAENFYLEAITVEPFPLLPGGHRVIDRNGEEMVVFYDFLTDEIKHVFPDNKEG